MRLKISHRTHYSYDAPVGYALSRLRKEPQSGPTQDVLDWQIEVQGAVSDLSYLDQFGNAVTLIRTNRPTEAIEITAWGEVETRDTAGVVGRHSGPAPLWLYLQPTARTTPGARVAALVRQLLAAEPWAAADEAPLFDAASEDEAEADGTPAPAEATPEPDAAEPSADTPPIPPHLPTRPEALGLLHRLSAAVSDAVVWQTGQTDIGTAAEEALAAGTGVCQDQAHVFIAAARTLGFPARYVGGYFAMDGDENQVAGHAWAEAHVPGLGWVGFDVANRVCPDERHVRVAVGRDFVDVSPVAGMRYGRATETMGVAVTVIPLPDDQQDQQQQQ